MPDPVAAPAPDADRGLPSRPDTVMPVARFVASVRLLLERDVGLVWVAGEISNFTRATSGHCYFNLKDAGAQVRCVFFRHKAQHIGFALKDGVAVEVRATASLYEARGEFQLNVETARLAGVGALYERFARLKARLDAAGWFDAARKRPLPPHPRAVGVVTSLRAAALRDVLTTLRRRWPALRVILYPTAVQGEGAAAEIAQAIRTANVRAEVDVLLVVRGGGSIEDLWAFNEEVVAQAVFESGLPVVSGVGHETDFTICDFVADARAATPTAAAALVTPDRAALAHVAAALGQRLARAGARAVELPMQRVDGLARRLTHPSARLDTRRVELAAQAARLSRGFAHALELSAQATASLRHRYTVVVRTPLPQFQATRAAAVTLARAGRAGVGRVEARVAALAQNLAHLSPQAVLDRGYAIVTRLDGRVVQDASALAPGDAVRLALARGAAAATITDTTPDLPARPARGGTATPE
jgi:exodeoxyribonuclease VII large subunit